MMTFEEFRQAYQNFINLNDFYEQIEESSYNGFRLNNPNELSFTDDQPVRVILM